MKLLVQRVSSASVKVDDKIVGAIDKGFLVFVGISNDDNVKTADLMIKKLLSLRIFEDENGKTNLSLENVKGSLLLVSQFTLYADCRKGNRPSFNNAGDFESSKSLYEYMVKKCREEVDVKSGIFGADMKVSLLNDGPFTIMLDSEELFK